MVDSNDNAAKPADTSVAPMTTTSMPSATPMTQNPVTGVESPRYRTDMGESLPPQKDTLHPDRAK